MKQIEVTGKNIDEAIALACKELNTNKDNISYEILEESNKRLFSILAPKFVRILATMKKEEVVKNENVEKYEKEPLTEETKIVIKEKIENFLNEFFKLMDIKCTYDINFNENIANLTISSESSGILIGYRGEGLDALQLIINNIINKNVEQHTKVFLDIENYREKRKKTIEDLAGRLSKQVISTEKEVTLEPMAAYERRIIHTFLQNNSKVETTSTGEEPYRRVVIRLKK